MIISTGLTNLDKMLKGGLHAGTITDISSPRGVGEFQLVIQILVDALTKSEKNILYQHTTGSFSSEFIHDIIKEQNLPMNFMDRIKVKRITDSVQQHQVLDEIKNEYSLIIISSITDLFSFEYKRMNNAVEKNLEFIRYMHKLSLLAIKHKVAILTVNTIRYTPERIAENMAKAISMYAHARIQLSKDDTNYHYTVLVPSQYKMFNYTKTSNNLKDRST